MNTFSVEQLLYQAPLIIVVVAALVILLLEAFARTPSQAQYDPHDESGHEPTSRSWLMWLTSLAIVVALLIAFALFRQVGETGARQLFGGMLVADRYSLFFTSLFLISGLLTVQCYGDYARERDVEYGEFYSLVLFAVAGMIILSMATDLVTMFLGIETMSLAVYVLTGAFRRDKKAAEGAMKYFLMGAVASAFLLYGIALVYGMTGSTNFAEMRLAAPALAHQPVFLIGEFFIIAAFGFKLALAPFHMWAPDAYEAAPTPVTGFMSAGVKAAAIAGVVRLFLTAFGGDVLPFGRTGWASTLAILAAITMTVGNIAALRQENVKRMLAYSSISHAGYLAIGLVAAGVGVGGAVPSMMFYLLAYTFTTIGAFGIIAWIGSRDDQRGLVDDWAGLASSHPAAALGMTVCLLSLAGMPPTAGFVGKFYVFRSAMEAFDDQLLWLVIVAALNSVVSVYYYLRIVVAMYFRDPARPFSPLRAPAMVGAIVLCVFAVLAMGLSPQTWLDVSIKSALTFVAGN